MHHGGGRGDGGSRRASDACRDGLCRRSHRLDPTDVIGSDSKGFRERQNYDQAESDIKAWIDLRSP